MTPDQLQKFRDILAANRQPVDRAEQYAFPRGWNECLDFVERQLVEILGEAETKKGDAA
jgi:hypothetical protein